MRRMLRWGIIPLLCFGMALSSAAQNRENPYSIQNIESLLKGGVSENRILSLVTNQCRNFELDNETRRHLLNVGATETLLTGLESTCYINPSPPVTQPEVEPRNQPPLTRTIIDQRLQAGSSVTIDLTGYFSDPENGSLTFNPPISSNPEVASATLERSSIQIDPHEPGTARVTVFAADSEGAEATITFTVVVSPQPRSNGLAMKLLLGGGAAALAGTAALLLLGGGGDSPGEQPPNTQLPGNPGLPPGF